MEVRHNTMKNARAARIKQLTIDLVRIQSDTGTRQERDVETYIHDWLAGLAYFNRLPNQFGQYPMQLDPLERSAIWALVKGQGNQTVILLHHHDVVDSFDYGNLAQWAYDPSGLATALKNVSLAPDVRQELESGDWLFGRGAGDMKGGAAIQLALLEEFSIRPNFKGNILLLSVPDEESLSVGMRGSLGLLVDLKEKYLLNYVMLINSEPHAKEQDKYGEFHIGSAGKILPTVYVRGKKTHIGHIYQGFNPVLLLSEIVLQTELNTDYTDPTRGEVPPPPSWSFMRDRKEAYDASIPASAGGYLSLIHLKSTPHELMQKLKASCEMAFERILQKIEQSHATHSRLKNKSEPGPSWAVNVKTFAELRREALNDSGPPFQQAYDKFIAARVLDTEQQKLDMPETTFQIIEMTLDYVKDLSPMVVIALCPPYYPPIHNDEFPGLKLCVRTLTDHLTGVAADRWQEEYRIGNYIMGITDLSYAALQNGHQITGHIAPNMPLWRQPYEIPFAEMQALSLPVINIGPWGKDHHKFTERVYLPDLCERTPALLESAIEYLLDEN
jgi:arginine utilization protein RocB